MKLNIFCNVSTRKAEASSSGQSLTFPEFTAGDRIKMGVRFTEVVDGARAERSLHVRAARLTLGIVDAAPTSGQWQMKVGGGASTSANTTPLLSHAISPSALQATLAALDVVSAGLNQLQEGVEIAHLLVRAFALEKRLDDRCTYFCGCHHDAWSFRLALNHLAGQDGLDALAQFLAGARWLCPRRGPRSWGVW
jgi:hypothetical protein